MIKRRRKARDCSGTFALEVTLGAVLVVVFFALGFDLVVGVWSFMNLDAAARDAARIAANAENAEEAIRMAKRAVSAHLSDGYFVSRPRLDEKSPEFQFVTNPNKTDPPSGSPYVVVTADCDVRLPIRLKFFDAVVKEDRLQFKRTYSYPLLAVPFNLLPDKKSDEDLAFEEQDWKHSTSSDRVDKKPSSFTPSPFSVPQLPPPTGSP